uniref:Uncharacterized protein n=1 Tax=Arundo donax TaxID=35708 RepID=A0A0A9A327_ARUDO
MPAGWPASSSSVIEVPLRLRRWSLLYRRCRDRCSRGAQAPRDATMLTGPGADAHGSSVISEF